MHTLARGQSSDCAQPVLTVFTPVDGILRDVEALEYVILDLTGPVPEQVYPAAGRATVDVSAPCPAGQHLGTGHYVAVYTPPPDASVGRYAVEWIMASSTGGTLRFQTPFEVLAAPVPAPQPGYCFLQDLRDEGFAPELLPDARLAALIQLASRYIESVTERFFEPRRQILDVDGRGASELLLGEPVIAIERLEIVSHRGPRPPGVPMSPGIEPESYRVYNRHITQGLAKPDDRDNPKIAFARHGDGPRPLVGSGFGFPPGSRNVRVTGLFGYTDFDGSPTGCTPLLIREVCKRLVAREIPLLGDTGRREDAQRRYRLIQEKTRDQSYTLDKLQLHGALTGDPEIDTILIQFKRPADLGAA